MLQAVLHVTRVTVIAINTQQPATAEHTSALQ